MKNRIKWMMYMAILLVFILSLFTGCRQSPLLKQISYSNDAEKIEPEHNEKLKNRQEEDKDVLPKQNYEHNAAWEKQLKNQGTGGIASGGNTVSADDALSQVVSDGGVQVQVPESVANVTTVGENTQGPHWRSSRIIDRNKYAGEWKADMFDGQGTYAWEDGDRYTGEWKADMLYGQGTYTWSDGDKYEGQWKDDMFEGLGTYHWASGSTYEGEWKAGVKDGQGTYTWANGDEYIGGWKSGVKEGQGIYTWADGSTYEGEWKFGIREGRGAYHGADGTVYEGLWSKDEFVNE